MIYIKNYPKYNIKLKIEDRCIIGDPQFSIYNITIGYIYLQDFIFH